MMGLQVITMADFPIGIRVLEVVLEKGEEVPGYHVVGAAAGDLMMMIHIDVVVEVSDLTIAGLRTQKAVRMTG